MIPIYICEDDTKQLEVISAVIKNRIMIENLDSYVHIATSDPIELLQAARVRTSSFGIYFLDASHLKNDNYKNNHKFKQQ